MRLIAWSFIVLGITEALISKYSCDSMCSVCTSPQIRPCLFLFVFVGIIFSVVGLSILSMSKTKILKVKIKDEKKKFGK